MNTVPRLFVVVPVLNEAPNLERLISDLDTLSRELAGRIEVRVVLVDDGSTDGSAPLARTLGASMRLEVLVHDVNRGPGAAFGTGFEHIEPELTDDDWVLTMEGDNTSRQELVQQMLVRAAEGFDVVLASPYMYGGGFVQTSWFRLVLSHVGNLFVKDALGLRGFLTMSSFFRLYRGRMLRRLQVAYGPRVIESRGFESMIEVLMKLVSFRAAISEVAMLLDSSARQGRSKMRITRTVRGYLALWWRRERWHLGAGDSSR